MQAKPIDHEFVRQPRCHSSLPPLPRHGRFDVTYHAARAVHTPLGKSPVLDEIPCRGTITIERHSCWRRPGGGDPVT
jgi:hypothetical protein